MQISVFYVRIMVGLTGSTDSPFLLDTSASAVLQTKRYRIQPIAHETKWRDRSWKLFG